MFDDPNVLKFIGANVSWKKVKGKVDSSMWEKNGFGVLMALTPGLAIVGDFGLYTTVVKKIEFESPAILIITTKNSVYYIFNETFAYAE